MRGLLGEGRGWNGTGAGAWHQGGGPWSPGANSSTRAGRPRPGSSWAWGSQAGALPRAGTQLRLSERVEEERVQRPARRPVLMAQGGTAGCRLFRSPLDLDGPLPGSLGGSLLPCLCPHPHPMPSLPGGLQLEPVLILFIFGVYVRDQNWMGERKRLNETKQAFPGLRQDQGTRHLAGWELEVTVLSSWLGVA